MKIPQTGGCQCGGVRYEIIEPPRMVYACHCTECQRMTSSAFSMALVLPAGAFRVFSGEPRAVPYKTGSGRIATRWICPDCGSWIGVGPSVAAVRNVRAGTLDDTSWLQPSAHLWTRSRQPWVVLPEASQIFETQPADLLGFLYSGS
jgi:hypothetical protein